MNPAETQTSGEFRRGWPVLSACLIGIGLGLSPLPFYTLGVFAPHLAKEFGWTTAQIMGGLSVTTLSVIVSGPAAGILAERYGTRRVALTSLVMFGFAFMAMALVGNSIIQYYLLWGLIALVGAGTLPITFTRTTNRWFDKHRGIALGVAMTGTGIFGILCKPYLIALPICLLLFRDPPEAGEAGHRPAAALTGMFRGEAMRSWRFRLIAFAMIIIPFCLAGPVPNLEGILRDRGFDGPTILSLTPLIGLSAIAGRLIGGLLLDRFWAPGVAFVMLSLPAIACLILAGSGYSPVLAAVAICMIGFALGIEYDIIAYLTSRYFGLRAYGGLYAILYVCFSVGSGLAPMIFGLLRDTGGDFAQALTISAIALPLASALFLLLGRYPVFKDAPA
jgi:MFS family permease